jgi:hypothetical protein
MTKCGKYRNGSISRNESAVKSSDHHLVVGDVQLTEEVGFNYHGGLRLGHRK